MKETAYLGMGCFWQPQAYFDRLPGVVATRVGYAGGTTPKPTYQTLGDHTEIVEVTFDSAQVSYSDLLKRFWQQHDPTARYSTQYRSVLLTTDDRQRGEAEASRAAETKRRGRPAVTAIEPLGTFTEAEAYHQKYLDKSLVG